MRRAAGCRWPVALLAVGLAGCIALPIPGDRSRVRDHLGEAAVPGWQTAVTRREDVLLALGDPDDGAGDGSWLAWEDFRGTGHLLVLTGGPYVMGGFETKDVLHYRKHYVFFDREGRFRASVVDTGSCQPPAPCLEASLPSTVERVRVDLLLRPALAAGESVMERFDGAVRRDGDRWIPGLVAITSQSVVFLDRTDDDWPPLRPALRLAYADLGVAAWAADGSGASEGSAVAALNHRDGGRHLIAFKPFPIAPPWDAPPFDRDRAGRLLEAVRVLRP